MTAQYSLSPLQAGRISVSRGKTLIPFMPETPMVSNFNLWEIEQINVISDMSHQHIYESVSTHIHECLTTSSEVSRWSVSPSRAYKERSRAVCTPLGCTKAFPCPRALSVDSFVLR